MSHRTPVLSPLRVSADLAGTVLRGAFGSMLDALLGLWMLYNLADLLGSSEMALPLKSVPPAGFQALYFLIIAAFVWETVTAITVPTDDRTSEDVDVVDDYENPTSFSAFFTAVLAILLTVLYKGIVFGAATWLTLRVLGVVPMGLVILPLLGGIIGERLALRRYNTTPLFVVASLLLFASSFVIFPAAAVMYTLKHPRTALSDAIEFTMGLFKRVFAMPVDEPSVIRLREMISLVR